MDLDFTQHHIDDTVRQEQVQKRQAEFTFIGSKQKKPGHILFYYNRNTKEIGQAEIQRCTTIDYMTMRPVHNDRVMAKKECIYMYAMNQKNFIKKLKRDLGIQI